jgi:hypothetical protein
VGRERLSRSTDLQQFENDPLLGLGFGAARANSPGCQGSEVGRGRAVVVSETRIRIGRQEGLACSRTSVSHRSMRRWHTAAAGGGVGISAFFDEIDIDIPLAYRVPVWRTGDTDRRRVQRFDTPSVPGLNLGAACSQVSCHLGTSLNPTSRNSVSPS